MIPYKPKKVNNVLQIINRGGLFVATFKTIRQTAATGILTEHRLRLMVAEGTCPGIRTGNRFMVNLDALAEMLDRESRKGLEQNVH